MHKSSCPVMICGLSSSQIIVGDSGLTLDQAKAQFAIWSMFAAVGITVVTTCCIIHRCNIYYIFISFIATADVS